MEDDLIANRLATIVGATCSIVRFREGKDAEKWLTDSQKVDLIISDKNSGQAMVTIVRNKDDYRLVPFLVTCRFGETHLLKTTLVAGVTDILVINEENYKLQSKIDYYLGLNSQVRAFRETGTSPTVVHHFRLPWWKRFIDISVSLTILILLSPVMLLVSLIIFLDSRGPIIYRSKRAGANFHVFDMYKFRTMSVKADQLLNELASQNIYTQTKVEGVHLNGAEKLCSTCKEQGLSCQRLLIDHNRSICEKIYLEESESSAKFMKFRNDPRVTRFGAFLRNSSIDELPQLVNILLGDMSLVGNRPLPLYEAEKLTSDEFAKRFAGPAGLTGLWQVKKRAKGQGPMSDRERTLLDIEYTNNFSFKTDLQIIWRTFFSLWQKENV
ncbi:sugar transferase [Spirosoma sp. KCTC 42546]|uniref:sugar transferase n=1 Tax=Spirosoma sp. KCTC 42546 TaxID=2520506 RepID=UPI00115C2366|nr:sugar transferase [Spirosoma sp. KCTC 42546]QDK79714.1 sugar transferase [Spirosoma sp. KCTC 42546]